PTASCSRRRRTARPGPRPAGTAPPVPRRSACSTGTARRGNQHRATLSPGGPALPHRRRRPALDRVAAGPGPDRTPRRGQPGNGVTPLVRVWTTANWGSSWTRGGLLPLGRDTLTGAASFTPAGWSGWLVIETAGFAQRVAVAGRGPLRLLPASLNASYLQLLGHGTGFAWGLDSGQAGRTVVTLSRTTDNGHSWRRSRAMLVAPPGAADTPLISFGDASHGWLVFGGVIWRTSDGGTGWVRG